MEAAELLEQLLDLARAAGLEVREARAGQVRRTRTGQMGEAEITPHSGICRVRGRVWVVLVPADAVEERIDVLGRALATHAREFLVSRYLPPAIRARLGPDFDTA